MLIPYELIHPLIEARVGQVKAEMERDFSAQLAKIDNLPTKWQLIGGAATGIVVAITLLYTVMDYFGARQDTAVERSATIAKSLESIDNRLANPPPQR